MFLQLPPGHYRVTFSLSGLRDDGAGEHPADGRPGGHAAGRDEGVGRAGDGHGDDGHARHRNVAHGGGDDAESEHDRDDSHPRPQVRGSADAHTRRQRRAGPDGDEITFAGQRGVFNNISLDGGDYNNGFFGEQAGGQRASIDITLDAVKEFQVIATGAPAEFGRTAGGVVNVITKSGTNTPRGSLFYFQRLESMTGDLSDGTNARQVSSRAVRRHVRRSDRKDKAFAFFALEGITGNFERPNLGRQLGSTPCPVPNPTIPQDEALINANPDCQRTALLGFLPNQARTGRRRSDRASERDGGGARQVRRGGQRQQQHLGVLELQSLAQRERDVRRRHLRHVGERHRRRSGPHQRRQLELVLDPLDTGWSTKRTSRTRARAGRVRPCRRISRPIPASASARRSGSAIRSSCSRTSTS